MNSWKILIFIHIYFSWKHQLPRYVKIFNKLVRLLRHELGIHQLKPQTRDRLTLLGCLMVTKSRLFRRFVKDEFSLSGIESVMSFIVWIV